MNGVLYPTATRNYCLFNNETIKRRVENNEKELANIKHSLKNPKSESDVIEDLYVLNILLDNGVETNKVAELYPELSKYNKTDSPNIQTYLAGIYRKTKIPDAFGPLCSMLIRNSLQSNETVNNAHFDPNEEIGGAILDYLA